MNIFSLYDPQTESYTAAKGEKAALAHTLAVSLAGKFALILYHSVGLMQNIMFMIEQMPYNSLLAELEIRLVYGITFA